MASLSLRHQATLSAWSCAKCVLKCQYGTFCNMAIVMPMLLRIRTEQLEKRQRCLAKAHEIKHRKATEPILSIAYSLTLGTSLASTRHDGFFVLSSHAATSNSCRQCWLTIFVPQLYATSRTSIVLLVLALALLVLRAQESDSTYLGAAQQQRTALSNG